MKIEIKKKGIKYFKKNFLGKIGVKFIFFSLKK